MKTRIFTQKRKEAKRTFETISGKCLEKVGLRFTNGCGYAVLDCTVKPKIGDLVHCDNTFGTIHGFIKQIHDIKDGVYIVGTAYEDSTRDFEFEASIIYGVVTYVFDAFNHNQLYEREGKETAKKPINTGREIVCPNCRTIVGSRPYCGYCGQLIDWSKESEGGE